MLALAAVTLLGLPLVASPAAAHDLPLPASVGAIFVDAQGRASGQNLAATIDEAQGALTGFASTAGGGLFDAVRVDGFAQAEKIQGVGSSSVTLAGSNAILTLTDTASTILAIHALDATEIRYQPASGTHALLVTERRGIVELRRDDGGLAGTLVAVGDDGAASRGEILSIVEGTIVVSAKAGTELVFLGGAQDTLHDALVAGLAEGALAAAYVTGFQDGATRDASQDFGTAARALTSGAEGVVRTRVAAPEPGQTLLAYDLAYETLPAADAGQVALYLDGGLALRVDSPSELLSYAERHVAAYFAQARDGRVQVLASVPVDASGHAIELRASASASTQQQAQAEDSGDASGRAYGGFTLADNGKLTGRFSTSIVRKDALQLFGYTELSPRAEAFRNVTISGGASASATTDGQRFELTGDDATLQLVDDALATLSLQARKPVEAVFEPGADAHARPIDARVVALEGSAGRVGDLILASGQGALDVDAQGRIVAHLGAGSTVIFRGATHTFPSDDALAQAIAAGRVGAQAIAGVQDAALATSAMSYHALTMIGADARHQGEVDVSYAAGTAQAQAFALDARGASLAAKSSADITVTVDGLQAAQTQTLAEALAAGASARYYAETAADGALRVIVNTASDAGHASKVVVSSRVAAAARAASNLDAFGTFRVFDDGSAVGSFVSLKVDAAAGAISGYTLLASGQPVFASVAAGGSAFAGQGLDGASALLLESREARFEITDTTTGFAKLTAKSPTHAAFRLANGLHAESRGAGVVEVVTEGGRDVGSLVFSQGASAAQTGQGEVAAQLAQGAQVLFRAHVGVESELSSAQRAMMGQAIAAGRVAGAVLVQTQRGLSTAARNALESTSNEAQDVAVGAAEQGSGVFTSAVTASYRDDVQIATAATQGRVDVTVASSASAGKTILVSLDRATIHGLATGDADILFDGQPIKEASSFADVLDPTDDHGQAEYFVLAGEAGTQVLVSIPHFSVHTVTLKERASEPSGAYMYATFALAVVVAAESVILYRRRQRKS
jgi:hypothetical protein